MRITPRLLPHVPSPRNISPKNLARSAPRAVISGNFPHPRVSLGGLKLKPPKNLTLKQQTHQGSPRVRKTPAPVLRKPPPVKFAKPQKSAHYGLPKSYKALRPRIK